MTPEFDPAELDDIPGTTIFTTARSRQAYHLHRFCMSLMKPAGREAFAADQRAYLDTFPMTEEQRQGVLDRDFNKLISMGGNIYFLVKISNADGWSVQRAVGTMSGMTADEYGAMMVAGGRSPIGNRSIKGGY
jgi:protocatechuate 4,5-dioxygenase alpha chain